jgi:hypothetical protein
MIKIEVNGGIKRLEVAGDERTVKKELLLAVITALLYMDGKDGDERALSDKVCAFGANLIKAAGAAMKELDEIGGVEDDYRGDQKIG